MKEKKSPARVVRRQWKSGMNFLFLFSGKRENETAAIVWRQQVDEECPRARVQHSLLTNGIDATTSSRYGAARTSTGSHAIVFHAVDILFYCFSL